MKTTIAPLDRLARTALRGQFGAMSDAELLRRFRADHDADAFAALVDRHGPMVLGLCKRLTRDDHLAEDAFQATFLTLSQDARVIRQPSSLPAWLFSVARRAALKARANCRRTKTLPIAETAAASSDPLDRMSARELLEALDAELARLPLAHRSALLLCVIEGKTVDEAARQLGATEGSVRGWLQRGRNRLRVGLARRGLALPVVLAATALLPRATIASPLVDMAVRIGTSTIGVSPSIAALTTSGMSFPVKMVAGIALLAAGLAGIGVALMPAVAQPPDAKPQVVKPVESAPVTDKKPLPARLDNFGDPLPEEALARFGTVRFRQGIFTQAIRYSPDGKTIVIAGWGRSLGLWDVATGKELFQFQFEGGRPWRLPISYSVAFSPDGNLLAEGTVQGDVRIWDARTGKLIQNLKAHTISAHAVVFAGNGKTLVSGGGDNKIRFWDVQTGQETATLNQHTDNIRSLAVSNDGKWLASGGTDKTIRIWNLESRILLRSMHFPAVPPNMAGAPTTLSFSPDGKQLASAGSKQCVIWDTATGEQIHQLHDEQTAARAFDEEMQRLPAKFREAVVLCCLEGLSRDEQPDWHAAR